MKTIILTTSFATAALLAVSIAHSAPTAGGGGGASAGAGAVGAAAATGQSGAATGQTGTTTTQPGTVVPGPTLPIRTIPYPPSTIINGTNAPVTNPAAMNGSGLSSNQFGNAESSNRVDRRTGRDRFADRDQTVTASDRVLLGTLKQTVQAALGMEAQTQSPVHFFIDNGTVTIVGTVKNSAECNGLLAQVQQTPGVLRVYNDLHVGTGALSPATTVRSPGNFFSTQTDTAFSASDKALLTTVQQEAAGQLGINGASGNQMPVHFSIENGVVGVSGRVNSPQEKAALLAAIGRTQGVSRVVDNVAVTTTESSTATVPQPANPSVQQLFPTSRQEETNRLLENATTNSSGF